MGVVVAEPVVQQLTAAFRAFQGVGCSGPGDVGLPPEAECQEDVAASGARPWRQGNGAPGKNGGHGGGNGKGAGMAPAAPPARAPPAYEAAAPVMPLGVWPAPGVGFGTLGAAPGGVVACLVFAVRAAAAGGGPGMVPCGGVPDGPPFLGGAVGGAVGHGAILPCGGR